MHAYMATFTTDDLLLYLYGNANNPTEIEAAILADWGLCEKYRLLANVHGKLNQLFTSPSQASMATIMAAASKQQKIKS
jgi:hypothetical protein